MEGEFIQVAGDHYSALNLAKFLCGISTPVSVKFHLRKLPHFGILERYPFPAVKAWTEKNTREKSPV
jgi:ATP-dependent DNA helicase RecQ